MATLGRRLARARAERRLTLRQVAAGTGLAESFLSKLEHDRVNVSVTNLHKLADFFGVGLAYFFEAVEPAPAARVVRAAARLRLDGGGPRAELVVPTYHACLFAAVVTAEPGQSAVGEPDAAGEERELLHFVLAGRVRFEIGEERHELGPGDAVSHRAHTGYCWQALGDEPASVLLVRSPPPRLGSE